MDELSTRIFLVGIGAILFVLVLAGAGILR
jgi:hypothetical protein